MSTSSRRGRGPGKQDEAAASAAEEGQEQGQERKSRAQTARSAEPVHEAYTDQWEEEGLLAAPPPRAGYAQRWVRTLIDGKDDQNNLVRRLNRGWRPRKADTVGEGIVAQKINFGDYGNVVGTHDMVLMERPLDLHERQASQVRESTQRLEQSVQASLDQVHKPGDGFTRPEIDETRRVSTRQPRVDDD